MTSVLNSKLMNDFLKMLSNENDYVARAMLSHISVINRLKKYINDNYGKETNIEEFLRLNKEVLDSTKYLAKIFKEEIKNYPKKLKDEKDFNTLILVYFKENILKFCNDQKIDLYYKRLALFIDDNIENIDLNILIAITLRALKIIKELAEQKEYLAIEKFVFLLNCIDSHINHNIIYIIYFGLNLTDQTYRQRRISFYEKKPSEKVIDSILNNDNVLPDSIIKHLFSDNQFKKYEPEVLLLTMEKIFMYTGDVGYEDYSKMINKILNNNLNNLDEEAEFYNIRSLCDCAEAVFSERKFEDFIDMLWDIKTDNLIFDSEEDSYGSV